MFESLPSEIESTKQTPKNNELYETLEPNAYLTLKLGQRNEYTKMTTELKSTSKSVNVQITYTPLQKKSSSDETDLHSELTKAVATRRLGSTGSSTTSPTEELGQVSQARKVSEAREPLPPPPKLARPRGSQPRAPPPNAADAATDAAITTAIIAEKVQGSVPVETLFVDEPPPDYSTSSPAEPRSRLQSLKDVPATIDSLNCGEIADCLRLLEMSKYVERFQENQIDGKLLVQLDESILTEELMLTPLHAKKLVMFAQKGWRPT